MKGYDEKPSCHRTFLDYHRFLFKVYHSQIISDPTRYAKSSVPSKTKPSKLIQILTSSKQEHSQGLQFSLVQSEIKNKSCEASSFKESYFDYEDEKVNRTVDAKPVNQSFNHSHQNIPSTHKMHKKIPYQKVSQAQPFLKALEQDSVQQQHKPQTSNHKPNNLYLKKQSTNSRHINTESELNSPKISMGLQSHKDLQSQKNSPNHSSDLLKSQLSLSNSTDHRKSLHNHHQSQQSLKNQKITSKKQPEKQKLFHSNIPQNKIPSTDTQNSRPTEKQSRNDQTLKKPQKNTPNYLQAKSESSDEQYFDSYKQKNEIENKKSGSQDSSEQDFESKIQNSINQSITKNQSHILVKANVLSLKQFQKGQQPSQQDSFHSIKNNQTIISNVSKGKEKQINTSQYSQDKEFDQQKKPDFILKDNSVNVHKKQQNIKKRSSSSEGSFSVDHKDQSDQFLKQSPKVQKFSPTDNSKFNKSQTNNNSQIDKNIGHNAEGNDKIHKQKGSSNPKLTQKPSQQQKDMQGQKTKNEFFLGVKNQKYSFNREKKYSDQESWSQSSGNDEQYEVVYQTQSKASKSSSSIDQSLQKIQQKALQKQKNESNARLKATSLSQESKTQQEKGVFSLRNQFGDFLSSQREQIITEISSTQKQIVHASITQDKTKSVEGQQQNFDQQSKSDVMEKRKESSEDHESVQLNDQKFDQKTIQTPIVHQQPVCSKSSAEVNVDNQSHSDNSQQSPQKSTKIPQHKVQNQQKCKELHKINKKSQRSVKQISSISNQPEEQFLQSLSTKVAVKLRREFSEELKSQKELFYYELKESLIEEIGEQFQSFKRQISEQDKGPGNLRRQDKVIKYGQDRSSSIQDQQVLGKQLRSVLRQQLTELIPCIVNEAKPIIYQQIKSLFSLQLSTILQDQLAKLMKQQLGNVVKNEITSSFRSLSSKGQKEEIFQDLKQQTKCLKGSTRQQLKQSQMGQSEESQRQQLYLTIRQQDETNFERENQKIHKIQPQAQTKIQSIKSSFSITETTSHDQAIHASVHDNCLQHKQNLSNNQHSHHKTQEMQNLTHQALNKTSITTNNLPLSNTHSKNDLSNQDYPKNQNAQNIEDTSSKEILAYVKHAKNLSQNFKDNPNINNQTKFKKDPNKEESDSMESFELDENCAQSEGLSQDKKLSLPQTNEQQISSLSLPF